MIMDPKILPVHNEIAGFSKKPAIGRKSKNERRKRRIDRRKSVRNGVIVKLSSKADRRNGPERRKAATPSYRRFNLNLAP